MAQKKIIQSQLEKLLELLSIKPEKLDLEIKKVDDSHEVHLELQIPEQLSGILIGFHGETLSALQFILSLIIHQQTKQWYRFYLNVNSYRDRRQEQLNQMAENAAKRALLSGDEIELPFLTPSERRLVHLALKDRLDIESLSKGEGRQRRLIVHPIKKEK